jgi:hypothetical protein
MVDRHCFFVNPRLELLRVMSAASQIEGLLLRERETIDRKLV